MRRNENESREITNYTHHRVSVAVQVQHRHVLEALCELELARSCECGTQKKTKRKGQIKLSFAVRMARLTEKDANDETIFRGMKYLAGRRT